MFTHYILEFLGAFLGSFIASYFILKEKTSKGKIVELATYALIVALVYLVVDFTFGIR